MANAKVVHFEIPADDTTRAREFWTKMFGVEFQSYDGPIEYHMFQNDDEQMAAAADAPDGGSGRLVVYFATEDIDATLDKVREAGGTAGTTRCRCLEWAGSPTSATPKATASRSGRTTRTHRFRPECSPARRPDLEQPRGIEELELWRRPSEDGLRHELTAREPEHVSVT